MKNYKLVLRDEADLEISEAYFWYESKSEGLGERFLKVLDECFKTIVKNPNLTQKVYKKKEWQELAFFLLLFSTIFMKIKLLFLRFFILQRVRKNGKKEVDSQLTKTYENTTN